jgi:hypothetical protein
MIKAKQINWETKNACICNLVCLLQGEYRKLGQQFEEYENSISPYTKISLISMIDSFQEHLTEMLSLSEAMRAVMKV